MQFRVRLGVAVLAILMICSLEGQVIRSPEISPGGKLVFEQNGDLWLLDHPFQNGPEVRIQRLTAAQGWDQHPTWNNKERSILFSSDRTGGFAIWKLRIEEGKPGALQQITDSPADDTEPTAGLEGQIVFVRGRGPESDLWLRTSDGEIAPLVTEDGADYSPRISPDGSQLLYLAEQGGRPAVKLYSFAEDKTTTILPGVSVVTSRWSPDGERIAFATRGQNGGVWLSPLDGSYQNLVTRETGSPAWSNDGKRMILGALPAGAVSYNGDPRRLKAPYSAANWSSQLDLLRVKIPPPPDKTAPRQTLGALPAIDDYRAARFDSIWQRLSRLYYGTSPKKEAWDRLGKQYRELALAAGSDSEMEDVIYRMLAERPTINDPDSGSSAVSSAHPLATEAGLAILRKGGNVVDAAVAVSFALGVVEPDASGIGGYGEMVLYLARIPDPVVIEFLTRVPEAAGLGNSQFLERGSLPPDGPVIANVPGTVAGMWLAWKKYGSGKLPWADLIQPAIGLAEDGFELDEAFTTTLFLEQQRFRKYTSSASLFFPEGTPYKPGQRFRNPDLAWTLRQIAEKEADGFYQGEVAKRLVQDLHGQGNPITLHDMRRYFAVERIPVQGTYHGHTIFSAAPAASGGASLVAKLNLLENAELSDVYSQDAKTLHAMIEAWKLEPSRNGRLADPSLWPIDLTPFIDKQHSREVWENCFSLEKATTPEDLALDSGKRRACAQLQEQAALSWGSDYPECLSRGCRPATGTTSFSVGDRDGNMVAVTQTLGTWGGNFYVTPGLGFLYNDKLRSYRSDPEQYGARLPYARNGTSIAPTLVFRGTGADRKPYLAVGAAGNAWITSAVYQIITSVIRHGVPLQEAVELPRFLVNRRRAQNPGESGETIIQIEDGISRSLLAQLRKMGHRFDFISLTGELRMGYASAVAVQGNEVTAAADPRRSGKAGAN